MGGEGGGGRDQGLASCFVLPGAYIRSFARLIKYTDATFRSCSRESLFMYS